MSDHIVPSTTRPNGIPLQALVTNQVRRNITSAGELCDAGKGFEIHMHAQGAFIYPCGTLPFSPKQVVAEAVRPPGGLYMLPPVSCLQAAKRAVTPKSTTSKISATSNMLNSKSYS